MGASRFPCAARCLAVIVAAFLFPVQATAQTNTLMVDAEIQAIPVDVEVTPNRPDQLSHYGIAREIAAMYGRDLRDLELMELEPADVLRAIGTFPEEQKHCATLAIKALQDAVKRHS